MDSSALVLYGLASLVSLLILYWIIKLAVIHGTENIQKEFKVNNALLRKSLSIKAEDHGQLDENWRSGFYTDDHYWQISSYLKEKERKEQRKLKQELKESA